MIDSESKKIQGYLQNSIITSPLDELDLRMKVHPVYGIVRDNSWHEEYMDNLASLIFRIVEGSVQDDGGVPAYLAKEESVPAEFKP